ncbi:MAG: hypothetical protein LBH16_00965 [Treponema sp.]|jgi:hypothetical protein|nr:hypothetical protein [Treponema sp.]
MKIEIKPEDFKEIDACICEIEKHAQDGMFRETGRLERFQDISLAVKKLRQTLREKALLVPQEASAAAESGEGGAA